MTKRVQILGHDFETANAFIGEERELTIDTDNWSLRVHDSTTPGGWLLYNRDQNDARYQARSVELDGLLGWEPNERGIVCRLGPANYQLRQVLGANENIGVNNVDGFAGDIQIYLRESILTDHIASGVWEFTQGIIATGGVTGNLVGNTQGTHTGNVIGNVVGNLTGNVTGNLTGSLIGGFDTRGAVIQMDPGQIDPSWIAGLDTLLGQFGIPIGGIIPYWGDLNDLPANWVVCDGTNGTPNLQDRFVAGAGSSMVANTAGGSTSHTHTVTVDSGGAHVHTAVVADHVLIESELPAHKHANGVCDAGTKLMSRGTLPSAITTPDSIDNNGSPGTIEGWTSTVGDGQGHSHGITVDVGGSHSHVGNAAGGSSLPPYLALTYIMRSS